MRLSHLLSLERQYTFYTFYHSNRTNRLIHTLTVPLLIISTLAILSRVSLPPPINSLNILILFLYFAYYLILSPVIASFFSPFLLLYHLITRALLSYLSPSAVLPFALTLHFASWVAQFVGHFAYEHRSPALFNSTIHAFLAAPLVIWLEVVFACGFLKSTKARLTRSRVAAKARLATKRVS